MFLFVQNVKQSRYSLQPW